MSQLFDFFKDKEAICFYFSDHGLDFFNSASDYFGYGIEGNQTSISASLAIPYVVYMSTIFQKKFTCIKDSIVKHSSIPLYTEDTIGFICQLLGIKYMVSCDEDVEEHIE